jgi:hypothetical protein
VIGDIYDMAEFLMRQPCFQTGTVVRVTAIVTQLVFEHALRIRVKAETSSSPAPTPTATPEGRSEATTPDNGSVIEVNMESEDAGRGSEEAQSEPSTTAASSIKGKRKEEAPGSDSSKEDGDEPAGSSNLVGKMNNLVSTDLENLVDGRDILLLGLSSSPLTAFVFVLMDISLYSFIFPAAGRDMYLVLVYHSWLERIRRVGCDDRPLPNPGHRCRKNPESTEGVYEACEYLALSIP